MVKIGNIVLKNGLILAPMAGVTDLPFRLLAIEQGCALTVSEMVSAKGLVMGGKTDLLLATAPEEKPFSVQIFGAEAQSMAEAAMMIEARGVQIIDINMGCPVKKVVSGGAGSALLKDLRQAAKILTAVRKRITIPLTIKIRTGWDHASIVALEVLKVAESCGVDALALHARTRSQGYGGHADWSMISEIKENAAIPIIGNGDVNSAEDVKRMMDETGCDGVMIGRGALGNPWLFREALDYLSSGTYRLPDGEEKGYVVLRHLRQVAALYGEVKAVRLFRKHLAWYARGMAGAARFRSTINGAMTVKDMERMIEAFFFSSASGHEVIGQEADFLSESLSPPVGMQ